MASLLPSQATFSNYKDRYFQGTQEEYYEAIHSSTTLYVGNLSFYTTEEQIRFLFSQTGEIKNIILGLDKYKKTPCGFCFVEYEDREGALDAMLYLNGTKLDDRLIRTDLDPGFKEGRQFGRGSSGGQVRDEFRKEFDGGRGGFGAQYREEEDAVGAQSYGEGMARRLGTKRKEFDSYENRDYKRNRRQWNDNE